MPRPLKPTVRQLLPIRQVLAGAAIAGAIAVAGPATANAATSICFYNTSTKTLQISDRSGEAPLTVVRVGDQIRFKDGPGAAQFCAIPGQFDVATVLNTEAIEIFRGRDKFNLAGGLHIDQSQGAFAPGATPELNGLSEIEIRVTQDVAIEPLSHNNQLTVTGTPQRDDIRIGQTARMHLNSDPDVDISLNKKPEDVAVDTGLGDDLIRSQGVELSGAPSPLLGIFLDGGPGNDVITGGIDREDIRGGDDDDRLYSVDANGELVAGEDGADFAIVDPKDLTDAEGKFVTTGGIGKLTLTPSALTVDSDRTAKLRMGWEHPKAWKDLRTVELQVFRGTDRVGRVVVRPATGKLIAHGAIKLARGSKMGHEGQAVRSKLALRLPKSLAGQTLSVDVLATDGKGRTQVEPAAALITVPN
jgi:hypothetical protein